MTSRVLIVDDDRGVCELLEAGLRKKGFTVAWRTSGQEALDLLAGEDFDVVVTDLTMPGMTGVELCVRVAENRPDLPVVVITAFGSLDTATSAIRAGAYDFITKPFEIDALRLTLERATQHRALREEVRRLRRAVTGAPRDEHILGESEPMRRILDLLDRVADSDASVLLHGESGTGKELIARTLHRRSRRAGRPFVQASCAGLPDLQIERELFGHALDAKLTRPGLFARGAGGTVFLEDIAELSLAVQTRLVRALERRAFCPAGGSIEQPFDVQVITATNRDLPTAVEERRFREDLYYLLNVVHLELPPLRARGADVLLLAQHFVERFAARKGRPVVGLSPAMADKLLAYTWPGNVRELASCIERAVVLARFDRLGVDDLPDKVREFAPSQVIVSSNDPADLVPMEEIERRYITRVLELVGGNKTQAALILGFDRATLYRKLERYGVRGGS